MPYWAKSQPIKLAWEYVKNYVARKYHPGRTHKDLRRHILWGMYGGVVEHGDIHTGVTPELAQKFINHTHKHINEFVAKTSHLHTLEGNVGYFQ